MSTLTESDTALFAGIGMSSKTESDPGSVKGTKLRVLKYPHPQVAQSFNSVRYELKFLFYFYHIATTRK
jgi:hypothetical protein